jgi:hypothetical protein
MTNNRPCGIARACAQPRAAAHLPATSISGKWEPIRSKPQSLKAAEGWHRFCCLKVVGRVKQSTAFPGKCGTTMTDPFTQHDLRRLAGDQEVPCLSLYMPTFRIGGEALQNTIRLKNLLVESEDRLLAYLRHTSAVHEFVRPIGELLNDGRMWADVSDGMALFRSTKTWQFWRLPSAFESVAYLGEHFYIKPLLPLAAHDGRYYLLAVSQNGVRLFEGTPQGLVEIHLAKLPKNLVETLHLHPPEGSLQARTASTAYHGKEGAVFHGQGAATAHPKDDILAYFRTIDGALHNFLRDKRVPLLFAGVGYLFPIYNQANSYPHLLKEAINGNPDYTNPADLHHRAAEVLTPHWHHEETTDRNRFQQASGTDRVSSDLKEILPAASQGRVEALFIASDVEPWGRFDQISGRIELTARQEPGSEELLDLAAQATIRAAGRVYVVKSGELPAGQLASALFRYSIAAKTS